MTAWISLGKNLPGHRRHYLDEPSPLSATLARYAEFFGLFGDYVDFFHLQDLVNEVTLTIKFSIPFEGFTASPLPEALDAYLVYRQRAIEFIESRNRRIAAHVGAGGQDGREALDLLRSQSGRRGAAPAGQAFETR